MSSSFRKKDDMESKLKAIGFEMIISYMFPSDEASALKLSVTNRKIQERGSCLFLYNN